MKCPHCGQWNRASFPQCTACGQPLQPTGGEEASWRAKLKESGEKKPTFLVDDDGMVTEATDDREKLAQEMSDLKKRKESGRRYQARLREESARRGIAPSTRRVKSAYRDEFMAGIREEIRPAGNPSNDTSAPSLQRRTVTVEGTPYAEGLSYDPLWYGDDPTAAWDMASTSRISMQIAPQHIWLRRVALLLLIITVAGLAIYGGISLFGQFQEQREITKAKNQAIITASIKDDLAAHTIMIPGTDGTQIYIKELRTAYIVTGGFATVQVEDHIWYDTYENFLSDTMEVTLTPFLKTTAGSQTPMDPITYTITIPLSPIELLSPDNLRTEVSTAMYALRFSVRPGSKVTVNGENYSDNINAETGEFSYNATVQPVGDNVFTVVVRSQYCRENVLNVTLYREPQEIPLDLASGTYSTTTKNTMKVTATTVAGAQIEVLSPYSDLNITELDSTGRFTFYALFDHIGNNTISIRATMEGKKPSLVNYTVYYLPSQDVYTLKAWSLLKGGYEELLGNIQIRVKNTQIYEVKGTVEYFVSEKPQIAVINTSPDGKEKPVVLQNYSKTSWKVGTSYRIFADAYSTYDGMPWLNARYTYPNGPTPTPVPEATPEPEEIPMTTDSADASGAEEPESP